MPSDLKDKIVHLEHVRKKRPPLPCLGQFKTGNICFSYRFLSPTYIMCKHPPPELHKGCQTCPGSKEFGRQKPCLWPFWAECHKRNRGALQSSSYRLSVGCERGGGCEKVRGWEGGRVWEVGSEVVLSDVESRTKPADSDPM